MKTLTLLSEFFDIPKVWAQVYYQLLIHGPGTIGTFLEHTNLSRQHTYNVLDKLVDEGFVIVISQSKRGNLYKSVPIEQLAKEHIHKLDVKLSKKKQRIDLFISELNHLIDTHLNQFSKDSTFYGKILGPEKIESTLKVLIEDTLSSFKLAIRDLNTDIMTKTRSTIFKIMNQNNVKVDILFQGDIYNKYISHKIADGSWFPTESIEDWLKDERLTIKLTKSVIQNYIIFDNVTLFLMFNNENGLEFASVTGIDDLTKRFLISFDSCWREEKNFQISKTSSEKELISII
jgi:sugar-specific transcriptional regulator TrmB